MLICAILPQPKRQARGRVSDLFILKYMRTASLPRLSRRSELLTAADVLVAGGCADADSAALDGGC
jgi:hypothetical protein